MCFRATGKYEPCVPCGYLWGLVFNVVSLWDGRQVKLDDLGRAGLINAEMVVGVSEYFAILLQVQEGAQVPQQAMKPQFPVKPQSAVLPTPQPPVQNYKQQLLPQQAAPQQKPPAPTVVQQKPPSQMLPSQPQAQQATTQPGLTQDVPVRGQRAL